MFLREQFGVHCVFVGGMFIMGTLCFILLICMRKPSGTYSASLSPSLSLFSLPLISLLSLSFSHTFSHSLVPRSHSLPLCLLYFFLVTIYPTMLRSQRLCRKIILICYKIMKISFKINAISFKSTQI